MFRDPASINGRVTISFRGGRGCESAQRMFFLQDMERIETSCRTRIT